MLKFAFVLATFVVACHARNKYYLYTPNNPDNGVPLIPGPAAVGAAFDGSRNTIVLVHGFRGDYRTSLNPWIKDAIFKRRDVLFNVIVVDWSVDASYSYSVAVNNVKEVAKNLVEFLEWLNMEPTVQLANFHLVGFDLGAHVVGIVGRTLEGNIGRITGLDPSRSQWVNNPESLKRGDARYVEVIHTDGRGILANGIGTALGDIDFYANGGGNQPGCLSHSCNHDRAFELFAASIGSDHLQGMPCASDLQVTLNTCRGPPLEMGGTRLSKSGSRIYRVNTKRTYPF